MKKSLKFTVSCFFIILYTSLICSCVSTDVAPHDEILIPKDSIFYINNSNDNTDAYEGIADALSEYGFKYEFVKNREEVPNVILPESSGSGFFIAPNIILTNAHIINDENNIKFLHDGQEENAKLIFINNQNDIAILETRNLGIPFFRLANSSEYDISIPVYALGYPLTDILGNEIRVTNGIINSLSGIGGDSNFMQISAQIQPGNSGGPVINNDYVVVGIASSKLADEYIIATKNTIAQNINFAIKSDIASLFANDYLDSYEKNNYVDSMADAMLATVKIISGGNKITNQKHYYIDYGYNANWDLIHYTASQMIMSCTDIESNSIIAQINERYFYSLSSIYSIAKSQTLELIRQINNTWTNQYTIDQSV